MKTNPNDLGFKSAEAMRILIESEALPAQPKWKSSTLVLPEIPNEPLTLMSRDLNDVIDYLYSNPSFSDDMDMVPYQIYESDGKSRVYHEIMSGDLAWEYQVLLNMTCQD